MKLFGDVDFVYFVEQILGYVGVDIVFLCREVGFIILKRIVSYRDNEFGLDSLNVQVILKGLKFLCYIAVNVLL